MIGKMTPEEVAAEFAKADGVLKNAPRESFVIEGRPAPPEPKPGELKHSLAGMAVTLEYRQAKAFAKLTRIAIAELTRLQARVVELERGLDIYRVQVRERATEMLKAKARVVELEQALESVTVRYPEGEWTWHPKS